MTLEALKGSTLEAYNTIAKDMRGRLHVLDPAGDIQAYEAARRELEAVEDMAIRIECADYVIPAAELLGVMFYLGCNNEAFDREIEAALTGGIAEKAV